MFGVDFLFMIIKKKTTVNVGDIKSLVGIVTFTKEKEKRGFFPIPFHKTRFGWKTHRKNRVFGSRSLSWLPPRSQYLLGALRHCSLTTLITKTKIELFGAAFHILPIVQIINAIFRPFSRVLIPIELEQLRKKAIANVGGVHDNFGNLDDWEAFEKFVEVADERAHFCGRVLIKDILTSILTTHLTISKTVKENPDILNEKIEKPIFLSAFTRSGATFLYQVLADTFNEEVVPNFSYEGFGGPIQLPHKRPKQKWFYQSFMSWIPSWN